MKSEKKESLDPSVASVMPTETETAMQLRLLQEQMAALQAQLRPASDGRSVQTTGPIDLSVLRINHLKRFEPSIPGGQIRYANRDNLERWLMDGWQVSPNARPYKDLVPIEIAADHPMLLQKRAVQAAQARLHEDRVAAEARKGRVQHKHGVSTETEYERSRGNSPPSPTSPKQG